MRLPGIILTMMMLLVSASAMAQNDRSITIQYKFENITPGYDHLTRMVVYVDEHKVLTGKPQNQSDPGKISFKIPEGEHRIKVVAEAFYEGKWEEHTVSNNYSIDCIYSNTLIINKNRKISLVFNLDWGMTVKEK